MVSRDEIIEVLKTIEDPELFIDIWFLGLIYNIDIEAQVAEPNTGPGSSAERSSPEYCQVKIEMTFTSPMCPAGPMLLNEVKTKIEKLPSVESCQVKIVFSPPWAPSDEVRAMLGLI